MTDDNVTQVTLSPNALRRLARLQARAEGANTAALAAMSSAQQAHTTLQEALAEECEYEGMAIPSNGQGQAQVDWRTGVVRLQLPTAPVPPPSGTPFGAAPLPAGNGTAPEPETVS